MRVVLDTSAIIYLNDFRSFEEIFVPYEVLQEIKDNATAMKMESLDKKIIDPSQDAIKEIKKTAGTTGDLDKLSKTDIIVLALAKENNLTIVSDDYNIQNVAEKLGIKYLSIFSKKITKLIIWKKFCKTCNKIYEKSNVCRLCGGKTIRKAVESKSLFV